MEIRPTATLTDLCLLSALAGGSRFLEELEEELRDVIGATASELCARLGRLDEGGLLEAYAWSAPEGERFYYRITNLGLCLLERDLAAWEGFKRRVDGYLYRDGAAAGRTAG